MSYRLSNSSGGRNTTLEKGAFGLVGDLIYGVGSESVPDVWGITVLPTYKFTDKLQLVTRYQFVSSEGDGVRIPGRYWRDAPSLIDGGWGDRYHAIYTGLNYYILDHQLKLMAGAEYADLQDSAGDGGSLSGWNFLTGIRLYF